jgi:hypothetical protein
MDRVPDIVMISVATAIFVGGSVWGLAWWLSGQFSHLRQLVYESINKTEAAILSKLEYHERHDDTRFDDVKRDIWEIKLRQASNTSNIRDLEKHSLKKD